MHDLKKQVEDLPQNINTVDVSRLRTTQTSPDYDPEEVQEFLNKFHRRFVITKVDKLNNTFVAVCKKYYAEVLCKDLQQSGFFKGLFGPVWKASDLNDMVQEQIADFGAEWEFLRMKKPKLAYANILVKMHKDPVAWRFLASCSSYNLKWVGKWLFRRFLPELQALWTEALIAGGLQGIGTDEVWFLKNSYPVVNLIKRFNLARVSRAAFFSSGGVNSKDCTRMYTHIPQDVLKDRMWTYVFEKVWLRHCPAGTLPGAPFRHRRDTAAVDLPVIMVYLDPGYDAVWYPNLEAAKQHRDSSLLNTLAFGPLLANQQQRPKGIQGRDTQKGDFCIMNIKDAWNLFQLLIDNAYVTAFECLFQQEQGIPIGISPGVYIANFFLFTYEYAFLLRLVNLVQTHPLVDGIDDDEGLNLLASPMMAGDPRYAYLRGHLARQIWAQFKFTIRYVDDLQSICNPMLNDLLYEDMSIAGGLVTGIYPRACPWEDSDIPDPTRVHFMDVLQVFSDIAGYMVGTTHLYDKRRERVFHHIDFVQYTHSTSALSRECLANILTAQVIRFTNIIMSRPNFIAEVIIMLGKLRQQGYKLVPLLHKYKRVLSGRTLSYGDGHWKSLYNDTLQLCPRDWIGAHNLWVGAPENFLPVT
jgi:hypothetical protein